MWMEEGSNEEEEEGEGGKKELLKAKVVLARAHTFTHSQRGVLVFVCSPV